MAIKDRKENPVKKDLPVTLEHQAAKALMAIPGQQDPQGLLELRFVSKVWFLGTKTKANPTGSRVGAVVRALAFHQCVPGSIPALGIICGLSLLVLYSAPRGFSLGTPVLICN